MFSWRDAADSCSESNGEKVYQTHCNSNHCKKHLTTWKRVLLFIFDEIATKLSDYLGIFCRLKSHRLQKDKQIKWNKCYIGTIFNDCCFVALLLCLSTTFVAVLLLAFAKYRNEKEKRHFSRTKQ